MKTKIALLTAFLALALPFSGYAYDVTQPTGAGTTADPYQITTLENLAWAMTTPESWNGKFLLMNNIDATATRNWTGDNDGFLGLGRAADPFTGTFDGNNKTITGLYMASTTLPMGFFIRLNGLVQDLTLATVDVTGGDNVGGLVATLGGQVISCTVTGKVVGDSQTGGIVGKMEAGSKVSRTTSTASVAGLDNVGGVAGYSCGLLDCLASGTVTGSDRVGGLVGNNACDDGILRSIATGDVSGANSVGGLEGEGNGPVVQSVAKGDVSASATGAGGLAGVNHKAVSDSYALGAVSGVDSVGGLIGSNADATAAVSRTFANGKVTGTSGVGGLIGRMSGFPTVSASYYDTTTTTKSVSAAGTGLLTANTYKAATFSGWDFSTVWEIVELVSPPTLQWENLGSGSGGGTGGNTTNGDQIQVVGFDAGCFLQTLSR